jgi:hypothetical protein
MNLKTFLKNLKTPLTNLSPSPDLGTERIESAEEMLCLGSWLMIT